MKASKGTAPGLSGLTHDMMAAVTYVGQDVVSTEAEATAAMSSASSLILRLVNVVEKSGYVYKQWRERAMRPIPKVPGDSSIDKIRPFALLDVLQKAFLRDGYRQVLHHMVGGGTVATVAVRV